MNVTIFNTELNLLFEKQLIIAFNTCRTSHALSWRLYPFMELVRDFAEKNFVVSSSKKQELLKKTGKLFPSYCKFRVSFQFGEIAILNCIALFCSASSPSTMIRTDRSFLTRKRQKATYCSLFYYHIWRNGLSSLYCLKHVSFYETIETYLKHKSQMERAVTDLEEAKINNFFDRPEILNTLYCTKIDPFQVSRNRKEVSLQLLCFPDVSSPINILRIKTPSCCCSFINKVCIRSFVLK